MTNKYFDTTRIHSIEDVKEQYHILALHHHPDHGGSTEAMQQINAEYSKLSKKWQNIHRQEKVNDHKNEVYTIITNQIIELLEAGVCPWKKPWSGSNSISTPKNLVSNKEYTGINTLILWAVASKQGFSCNKWATMKQINDKGGKVIKGSKSTAIVFWKMFDTKEIDEVTGEPIQKPVLRYYRVFNLDQTEGLEKYKESTEAETFNSDPIEAAEEIQLSMPNRPTVLTNGEDAYWQYNIDTVTVPNINRFQEPAEYYSALFHELTHSTEHESRLNRKAEGLNYAQEELVAEIGSAFLCAKAGIVQRTIEMSAAYLQHWISHLKNDPKLIVKAAAKAQKAADYIYNAEGIAEARSRRQNSKPAIAPKMESLPSNNTSNNLPAVATTTKTTKQGSLLDLIAA